MSYAEKRYQQQIIILSLSGKSSIQEVADWAERILFPAPPPPLELHTRKMRLRRHGCS